MVRLFNKAKLMKRYYVVEHIWRALRSALILLGTGLWLYDVGNTSIIMLCYVAAAIVDQAHGYICRKIEIMLKWDPEHNSFE